MRNLAATMTTMPPVQPRNGSVEDKADAPPRHRIGRSRTHGAIVTFASAGRATGGSDFGSHAKDGVASDMQPPPS